MGKTARVSLYHSILRTFTYIKWTTYCKKRIDSFVCIRCNYF